MTDLVSMMIRRAGETAGKSTRAKSKPQKGKQKAKSKAPEKKWVAFEFNTRERKQSGEPQYFDTKQEAWDAAMDMKHRHRNGSIQQEVCIQFIAKVNPKTFTVDRWFHGECAQDSIKVREPQS